MGVELAAVTIVAGCCIVLLLCHLVSATDVQVNIVAEPGQTVSLPCQAPGNLPVIAVEWSRPDLEPDYVLLYRDKQSDTENQHPSFLNRVELKDEQMKDGDVSLIVKNVVISDNGTYECCVIQRGTNRRKRSMLDTEPITTINLTVTDSGETAGLTDDIGRRFRHIPLCISLPVFLIVGCFLIYRKHLKNLFYQVPIKTAVLHG